jgi:phage baseplate assembly protein W
MANIEINITVTDDDNRSWVYKDLDETLGLDSVKRDFASYYNESAINNSLANLVRIKQGERQFQMEYGIDIEQFLYEPINSATARSIGDRIKTAIKRWEPRISLKNVNIVPNIADNQYTITVTYSIPLLSSREYEMQYSLSGAI